MVIEEIGPESLLAQCRMTLGLPDPPGLQIEDELIAALLRRAAGYMAPCSRAALRAALVSCLQKTCDEADFPDRVDDAIDWLLAGGDLLELNDVTTSEAAAKGTWVYPAPPTFIVRPSGTIFLAGTVPDQDVFLPPSLASRVQHEGFVRYLKPEPGKDLAKDLSEYGLQHLSDKVWLKSPREEALEAMLASYRQMLTSQGPSGDIAGLTILETSKPVTFYKGRWAEPKPNHSGMFVARRPQEFGSSLWGLVLLENGQPERFLDFPKKQRSRWRGCDEAWLVQMAIDHEANHPQCFRLQHANGEVQFDFFSPLPSWAQRRLILIGRSIKPVGCLLSFVVPGAEAPEEERFLRSRLWLANTDDQR